MKKQLFFSGLIALVVSVSSLGVYSFLQQDQKVIKIEHVSSTPGQSAVYKLDEKGNPIPIDFNKTAEAVIDGVVHIKSTQLASANNPNFSFQGIPDPFKEFFGPRFRMPDPNSNGPARIGTGSGVIISEDGYIVTNNHVIDQADDIEVTLHDNRTFKALVIGVDPTTDLALLQIKGDNFPTVAMANSDQVNIGQWVLAVGNPMGLNSTVTAGIVSATGRNINILKDKYAVENFIQTDAAINPGNSGGALVNLEGGLIGINTAIASPTGTFAGYGFAVPSSIVQKVVEDLIQYGMVQRGVLGIMIRTVDGSLAKEKDLTVLQGVFVDSLFENSAAATAGVQVGDVILSVEGIPIKSASELQGVIARYRPGQKVNLILNRSGKEIDLEIVLKNRMGNTDLDIKDDREILKILGANFEDVDKALAKKLDISGGVKIIDLYSGKLRTHTQIRNGFIITHVDGEKIRSVDQLVELLEGKKGGVMIQGVYEDIPGEYFYAFGL